MVSSRLDSMLFQALKSKFLWSTAHPAEEKRRHTFRDRTRTASRCRGCLEEKRCVSMPSIASSGGGSSPSALRHRSRLLRLQERRFRHRFPQVPQDERLVNYFSCALVSDILLQGHLFISESYFAFYSNIFGHKTQILIPVADVIKVTKEKTAKIIPNAVGVSTEKDKYVFGSMLSRDTAFRVIHQIWIHSTDPGLGLPEDSDSEASPAILLADEDSSLSSGVSGQLATDEVQVTSSELATTPEVVDPPTPQPNAWPVTPPHTTLHRHRRVMDALKGYIVKQSDILKEFSQLSRTTILFLMSTVLLVILFISTTLLLYRIHLLHQKLTVKDDSLTSNISSLEKIPDLIPSDFKSIAKTLEERIQNLIQVRLNLEKLITLDDSSQVPKPQNFDYAK